MVVISLAHLTIMKYKNSNKSLKEIGKELGVANILEGSIRRVGERVRITGQLINAICDEHLWAEKYDRDIKDIFAVQDEVANSIANALRIELSDDDIFMVKSDRVLTMTECKDKKIIEIYNNFLNHDPMMAYQPYGQVGVSSEMGYVSTVQDARKRLEELFKITKPKES